MLKIKIDDKDDINFIFEIEKLIINLSKYYKPKEIDIFKIDNWFDHKWLGFFHGFYKFRKNQLKTPPFAFNRLKEGYFYILRNEAFELNGLKRGKDLYYSHRIGTFFYNDEEVYVGPKKIVAWYSGNISANAQGSIMIYLLEKGQGPDLSSNIFYLSYRPNPTWEINKAKGISEEELKLILIY